MRTPAEPLGWPGISQDHRLPSRSPAQMCDGHRSPPVPLGPLRAADGRPTGAPPSTLAAFTVGTTLCQRQTSAACKVGVGPGPRAPMQDVVRTSRVRPPRESPRTAIGSASGLGRPGAPVVGTRRSLHAAHRHDTELPTLQNAHGQRPDEGAPRLRCAQSSSLPAAGTSWWPASYSPVAMRGCRSTYAWGMSGHEHGAGRTAIVIR